MGHTNNFLITKCCALQKDFMQIIFLISKKNSSLHFFVHQPTLTTYIHFLYFTVFKLNLEDIQPQSNVNKSFINHIQSNDIKGKS